MTSPDSTPITAYESFLENKSALAPSSGRDVSDSDIHPSLHPFQRDLTRWALRKGRSAIFANTGLGKTRMQLEWARLVGTPTLIVAPLAVARQTVKEAALLDIDLTYARSQADADYLTITNYEMVSKFDPAHFGAVVLDESSILKAHDGKTRTRLIEQFAGTPYRLCCTATPAPNDIAELANHAEFLGILSRVEMLSQYFVHDDEGWRLKGHAREPFYRWLASWGMSLQLPSDLGYADDGYILPPLSIDPVIIETEYTPPGQLFATTLKGVGDRANVRKSTVDARVAAAVEIIAREPNEKWLIWCGLNDEQDKVARALGSNCVSVFGSLSPDEKIAREIQWREGAVPALITKPQVFGFGMNWQHCSRMIFIGLGDSYEQYYQSIRRCWRYGQNQPVSAYVILSNIEEPIYFNVLRKEKDAAEMSSELVKHVSSYEKIEIGHARQTAPYLPTKPMILPSWLKGE